MVSNELGPTTVIYPLDLGKSHELNQCLLFGHLTAACGGDWQQVCEYSA